MQTPFDPRWIASLEPAEVYKQDHRSRVWRVETPDGRSYVIKRFEYNPLRQALAVALGMHPGQRERRCCDQLHSAWVPVVPIIASGKSKAKGGVKYWLVTPYLGISLYNLFHHSGEMDSDQRTRVIEAAGLLTWKLIHKGLFNRDHKASNILIDEKDNAWLIDVGGIRLWRGKRGARRMLAGLRTNLAEAGATEADLSRLEQASQLDPSANSTR